MQLNSAISALVLSLLPLVTTAPQPKSNQLVTPEQCHLANIWFEAKGESLEGMKAVANVVINRAIADGFPGSICAVVFQRKQFSWTHQRSYAEIAKVLQGDTAGFNAKELQAYQLAEKVAYTPNKELMKLPRGVLWYHSTAVKPKWTSAMKRYRVIGNHAFYMKK